jgi:TPR repeat protein
LRDVTLAGGNGSLRLVVVRDALVGHVDASGCPTSDESTASVQPDPNARLDPLSVRGVCVAEPGGVSCSAGALDALLEDERDPNPTALFLLAHEFAHVAQGETGADDEHTEVVAAAASQAQKIAQLQEACRRDDTMLKQEQAADEVALKAAVAAFGRDPFKASRSRRAAVADNFEAVYQGTSRLQRWLAITPGQGLGHSGGRYFCEVLGDSTEGEIPFYGGGHPRRWTRMAELMQSASKAVGFDDSGKESHDNDLGSLPGNSLTDGFLATAQEDMVRSFCRDVNAFEAGRLDCKNFQRPAFYDATAATQRTHNADAGPAIAVSLATPALSAGARAALEQRSHVDVLHATLYETYRGKQNALAAQNRAAAATSEFLRTLERWAVASQGVWLFEKHSDVAAAGGLEADEFTVTFEMMGVLRSARPLHQSDLGSAFPGRLSLASAEWEKTKFGVAFYLPERSRGPSDGVLPPKDELQVDLRPASLDAVFDFDAAAAGKPGQATRELFAVAGYAYRKMVASGRSDDAKESVPARVVTFPRIGDFSENIEIATELPKSVVQTASANAPAHPDERIEAAFDYADHSRQLGAGELAALFGNGAGEGSKEDRLVQQGLAFKRGEGVPKDDGRAVACFKAACDGGSQVGCGYFAGMLLMGRGVPAQPEHAVELLRSACKAGAQNACTRLGSVYLQGLGGVARDTAKALSLLEKSCKAKDSFGCAELGAAYAGAPGIDADGWLAAMYLQRACEGGLQESCVGLGVLLLIGSVDVNEGPRSDRDRSQALFAKACDERVAEGCNQLGQGYLAGLFESLDGLGEPNVAKAEPVLATACELGAAEGCYYDASAMVHMGLLEDDPRVRARRKAACDGGFKKACQKN